MSERRACSVTEIARSSMGYDPVERNDDTLRLELIRLAKPYGRYGYRKITELLRADGCHVHHSLREQ